MIPNLHDIFLDKQQQLNTILKLVRGLRRFFMQRQFQNLDRIISGNIYRPRFHTDAINNSYMKINISMTMQILM